MIRILRENNNELKQIPLECLKGATLLTYDEAEKLLTQDERKCKGTQEAINNELWVDRNGNSHYWLRSAVGRSGSACYVDSDGDVYCDYDVDSTCIGMRPALIISNLQSLNLRIGDRFVFGDYIFKVISSKYALCDVIVDACPFNKNYEDGNNYETSYVKQRVDNWFDMRMQDAKDISQGLKTDKMIADEMDLGF